MAIADLTKTSLPACIYPLSEPLPLMRCGGKAWHLRRMLELNLPVPAGLVITSEAFEAFLDRNGLRGPLDELLHGREPADAASKSAAAQKLPGPDRPSHCAD